MIHQTAAIEGIFFRVRKEPKQDFITDKDITIQSEAYIVYLCREDQPEDRLTYFLDHDEAIAFAQYMSSLRQANCIERFYSDKWLGLVDQAKDHINSF